MRIAGVFGVSLAILSSLPFCIEQARGAPLKLCLSSDTGEIRVRQKCKKKSNESVVSAANLSALIGTESKLNDLEGDLGSVSDNVANLGQTVTNLAGSLPTILVAKVSANGSLVGASSNISSQKSGDGHFILSYDRDVSGCFYHVTPTMQSNVGFAVEAHVDTRPRINLPNQLEVFLANDSVLYNRDFFVTTICLP